MKSVKIDIRIAIIKSLVLIVTVIQQSSSDTNTTQ